jgi:hypothetical protein
MGKLAHYFRSIPGEEIRWLCIIGLPYAAADLR